MDRKDEQIEVLNHTINIKAEQIEVLSQATNIKDEEIRILNQIISVKDDIILDKENRIAELEKKVDTLRSIIAQIHNISNI